MGDNQDGFPNRPLPPDLLPVLLGLHQLVLVLALPGLPQRHHLLSHIYHRVAWQVLVMEIVLVMVLVLALIKVLVMVLVMVFVMVLSLALVMVLVMILAMVITLPYTPPSCLTGPWPLTCSMGCLTLSSTLPWSPMYGRHLSESFAANDGGTQFCIHICMFNIIWVPDTKIDLCRPPNKFQKLKDALVEEMWRGGERTGF